MGLLDEESLVNFVESQQSFSPEEISGLLSNIEWCIHNGTPASYFSQALDKLLDNEMPERDATVERAWQDSYDDDA